MSIVFGYLLFILNLAVVFMISTNKYYIFADVGSLLIVAVSVILMGLISFKSSGVLHIFRVVWVTIKRRDDPMPEMLQELIKVAKDTRGEITQAFSSSFKSNNFFLMDGIKLIGDGFSEDQISTILHERIEAVRDRYDFDEKVFKAIRTVPPAFGMMGTTVGLVALFAEIGGADALNSIGPALAVALVSTLYGLILAYCFLSPLTERLCTINYQDIRVRDMTRKGIILIKRKAPPSFIEEMLSSYLTHSQKKQRVA
jgi:chemotaxis protein MotA